MIRHAHADRAESVRFRALDRFARGEFGDHMTDTVVSVDDRDAAGVDDEFRLRHRFHHAVADAVEIPAEAQYAVRLVSPQIRLHERVGHEARIALGHARAGIDSSGEIEQFLRIDAHAQSTFRLSDLMTAPHFAASLLAKVSSCSGVLPTASALIRRSFSLTSGSLTIRASSALNLAT